MAFNFETNVLNKEQKMQSGLASKKILLYGKNNVGKTFQATKLSKGKTFLIATEAGDGAITSMKEPCDSWSHFKEIVSDLTKPQNIEKRRELIDVVVIDTAENLVELSEMAVAREFGVRTVGDVQQASKGNPNGYLLARTDFKAQINKLCLAGYCVVFIAHEERTEEINEMNGETYQFIQPKGCTNEKSSMRMLLDLCDFTIYVKPNPVNRETLKVTPSTAICVRTEGVFARSRFDIQPLINPFTADGLKEAIENAVKKSADENGVGVCEFSVDDHKSYTKEDYFDIIKPYVDRLFDICGDEIVSIIENQLGEGKRVTDATDDDLVALDSIYNNLVTKATMLGIDV